MFFPSAALSLVSIFCIAPESQDQNSETEISKIQSVKADTDWQWKVDALQRSLIGRETVTNTPEKFGWTENLQINLNVGRKSDFGIIGAKVSPFVAVTVEASERPDNMAHRNEDGSVAHGRSHAYFGRYNLFLKRNDSELRWGLQEFDNPFLTSNELRGLPPAFRGLNLLHKFNENFRFDLGSVDAYRGRNKATLSPLRASYGDFDIGRLDFAGFVWNKNQSSARLYYNQTQDAWRQLFIGFDQAWAMPEDYVVSFKMRTYHSEGRKNSIMSQSRSTITSLEGRVDTGQHLFKFTLQKNFGDAFFDYANDTWGNDIGNAFAVDFNAPNERSQKISWTWRVAGENWKGLSFESWYTSGFNADGKKMAYRYADRTKVLHGLYWKAGEPVHGGHQEMGLYTRYKFQSGSMRGASIGLLFANHRADRHYPDSSFHGFKLNFDVPFTFL